MMIYAYIGIVIFCISLFMMVLLSFKKIAFEEVSELKGEGIDQGIILTWKDPVTKFSKIQIGTNGSMKPENSWYIEERIQKIEFKSLENGTLYQFRIGVVNEKGARSVGQKIKVIAGIQKDENAWGKKKGKIKLFD